MKAPSFMNKPAGPKKPKAPTAPKAAPKAPVKGAIPMGILAMKPTSNKAPTKGKC